MISTLCMELHAFEYMRFHLAVSGEVQDIGQLPGCVTEAELTMGERLFIWNSQFLDKIPENSSVGEDVLFKPFSVAIRQCLELQEPERMLEVVERLHMDALACKMNGAQMLRLVREAYRLFLLSGVFQNEYHFDEGEEQFCRQAELCSSHERLFDFLADTLRIPSVWKR
ncbi:hypothetical protein [Laedolimicola sp.]|uniref:hypothetical protein n=1 Tax=Laedolimicola sp. TaxID=2981663 RepID=UPI003F7D82C0